jgi:hypothetical protein
MIRPGVSLDYFVRQWAAEMSLRPTEASKPENLQALVQAADASWDGGFAALHAPVSPLHWEAAGLLGSADDETDRAAFDFPYRMEIVGMRASLSVIQPVGQGLVIPTIDDILCAIDINEQENLTALDGQTAVGTTKKGGNFVTLGSLSVQAPHLWGLKLVAPKPNVGARFRWKQKGVFADCLISVCWYVREMDPRISANVPSQYER